MIKKTPERLRRWGWFRTIGAALTLAGATVVFVVLILPTTAFAGHPPYCAGDNTIRIFSFSPKKAKVEGNDTVVTVLGANFQEEVTNLYIGKNEKGTPVTTWASLGDNTITFTVPDGAPTGAQHFVIASSTPGSSCLAVSKSTLRIG